MAYKPYPRNHWEMKAMVVCTIGLLSPELAIGVAVLMMLHSIGRMLWNK